MNAVSEETLYPGAGKGVKGGSRGGGGDGLTSSGRQLSAGGGHTKPRCRPEMKEEEEERGREPRGEGGGGVEERKLGE